MLTRGSDLFSMEISINHAFYETKIAPSIALEVAYNFGFQSKSIGRSVGPEIHGIWRPELAPSFGILAIFGYL